MINQNEKEELLRQKEVLFRFITFHQKHKATIWEDEEDFQKCIDDALDQIIRVNQKLEKLI